MTASACAHALCLPYGGCQFDSDVHTDAHGNVVDTCGHCILLPTTSGSPARAVQAGCPVHSGRDSTVARRVPTEVERAAAAVEAGHAWRHTANSRPGYATWPHTQPGDPSWWRHDPCRSLSPVARVMAGLDGPPPVDGEKCAKWCGFCHLPGPEPTEPHPDVTVVPAAQLDQDSPQPCRGCHACATDEGEVALTDIRVTTEPTAAPRRRWWHRLTRRNP